MYMILNGKVLTGCGLHGCSFLSTLTDQSNTVVLKKTTLTCMDTQPGDKNSNNKKNLYSH